MKLQKIILSCCSIFALASCGNSNSIAVSTKQNENEKGETTSITPTIKVANLSDFYLVKTTEISDSKTYVQTIEAVNLTYNVGYNLLLDINTKFKPSLDKLTYDGDQYAPGPTNYYHIDFVFKSNDYECKINIPEKEGDVFKYLEKKDDETVVDVFTEDFTFDEKAQNIYNTMKTLFEEATTK